MSRASSTTACEGDAVEDVFRHLLDFKSLRFLWPQLTRTLQGSRKRCLLTIASFLKHYSEDLGRLATAEGLHHNESLTYLSASRFVRKVRHNLAFRLWEAHSHSFGINEDEKQAQYPLELTEGETDDYVDPTFIYSVAERFLFDTEPIQTLEANIKAFVKMNVVTEEAYRGLPGHKIVKTCFANFMANFQSPVKPGTHRVSWKCNCGRKMYDDYTELQPGAARRLEATLNEYFEGKVMNESDSVQDTPERSFASVARRWMKGIHLPDKLQMTNLPRHHSPSERAVSQLGVCPVLPDIPPGDHSFVLLCVPFMRTSQLHQPEVCKMNSDREFFRVLRYYYVSRRKTRTWTRLRTVRAINFVKFETYKSQLVDVQKTPSIPPESQVGQDYGYDPLPAETSPPIGPNLLMHLFEHPEDAEVLPVLSRKIPKKLRDKLEPCPVKGSAIGWGVQFVEGTNWFVVFLCGCVGFAAALTFAVVWSAFRGDIQGGFAIAGFMLAFLGFCVGIARVEDPLEA